MTRGGLAFNSIVDGIHEEHSSHRFFTVALTTYIGKDADGAAKKNLFLICCVLPNNNRWSRFPTPRIARGVQIQGKPRPTLKALCL